MATTSTQTVAVGVFRDRDRAQEAIRELKRQGFTDQQIGVAAKHDEDLPAGTDIEETTHAGTGAGAGAAAGLGVGGLWGLGIAAGMLPAIGPVIAGGVLASILASAAAGAAAGGLVGALIGLGIPNEEAEYYEREFQSGGIIVTVRANGRYDEVRSVLQQYGAYDIHSEGETGNVASQRMSDERYTRTPGVAAPGQTPGGVTGHRPDIVGQPETQARFTHTARDTDRAPHKPRTRQTDIDTDETDVDVRRR